MSLLTFRQKNKKSIFSREYGFNNWIPKYFIIEMVNIIINILYVKVN